MPGPRNRRVKAPRLTVPPEVSSRWKALPGWVRRLALPALITFLGVLYPYYWTSLPFSIWPSVDTAVVMLVFMMMAVGLNIVVGYAGLLDLGYVAFYAIGAYT